MRSQFVIIIVIKLITNTHMPIIHSYECIKFQTMRGHKVPCLHYLTPHHSWWDKIRIMPSYIMHTKSWWLKYGRRNSYPIPFSTYALIIIKPLPAWFPSTLWRLPCQLASYQGLHNPYTNILITYLLFHLLFSMLLVTYIGIINIFDHVYVVFGPTTIIINNNYH